MVSNFYLDGSLNTDTRPGDAVRVTLSDVELTCEVVKTDGLDN